MKKIVSLLVGAVLVTGCQPPPTAATPTKPVIKSAAANTPGKPHDHSHDVGPHKGTIFDFGKYHAEFTVDHAKQEVVVYILGDDMDTPTPVVAEKLSLTIKEPGFTVELKPSPDAKDPAGKSSRFTGKHEKFGKEQEFAGTVAGVVDGKPASGDFKEEDEHDHKDEKKDAKKDEKKK
jgi:hypothetical protein